MKFFVDLRNERSKVELFGKLSGIEISHGGGLNFARIDLGVGERLETRFLDNIAKRFALFLEVPLKIRSASAENVNWFVHRFVNLAEEGALSSRGNTRGRAAADY